MNYIDFLNKIITYEKNTLEKEKKNGLGLGLILGLISN